MVSIFLKEISNFFRPERIVKNRVDLSRENRKFFGGPLNG